MNGLKVLGTVILNKENGKKNFLIKQEPVKQEFVEVKNIDSSEYTVLASILKELKQTVGINPEYLELIELTNVVIGKDSIPFFVFEMDETDDVVIHSEYKWKEFSDLKKLFDHLEIESVALLN